LLNEIHAAHVLERKKKTSALAMRHCAWLQSHRSWVIVASPALLQNLNSGDIEEELEHFGAAPNTG
jgi:hypothetical protein